MHARFDSRTILLRTVWILLIFGWAYAGWLYWQRQGSDHDSDPDQGNTDALAELRARLDAEPQNFDGWLLIGRSYTAAGRMEEAVGAFERAYILTNGENVEATLNLAEALVARNPDSLADNAGTLFEKALTQVPNHPNALWYAAYAALERGDLALARDRLRKVLAHNPPPEVRARIEDRISTIDRRLESSSDQTSPRTAEGNRNSLLTKNRTLQLDVRISDAVKNQQDRILTLFVVAYALDSGARVAVQRRSSIEAPLTVHLMVNDSVSEDIITPSRRYRVVALMSSTDDPILRGGDFYGETIYDTAEHTAPIQIIIDRQH